MIREFSAPSLGVNTPNFRTTPLASSTDNFPNSSQGVLNVAVTAFVKYDTPLQTLKAYPGLPDPRLECDIPSYQMLENTLNVIFEKKGRPRHLSKGHCHIVPCVALRISSITV